ncbi:enoyl-CoA hydratase [Streptomyces albus]|uniref:Enoyl-CoA hydratase n=1 Tax=Streptomyces albus (strain ATCC 21838 / DSM 41398 / FERM P-419 / JCM 4703 / NBRC 107858) TaxID=1081613 RepID=A0A0B5EM63_STRA4|nr:enoyl-CoA hydratase [Streptomyces albus]AOU74755.1 enoyl-CoA hydratase [Streptomyces albus]AYN30566.1 enoyl-CoA hydratase [Streptomyces albus]
MGSSQNPSGSVSPLSDQSPHDPVLTADDGPVRIVTLHRPTKRNAIDMPLRIALAEALEAAMTDERVRVIVLTGAGGTFSSGGDISTMQRQEAALTRPRAQAAQRVIRAIWQGPKPVVAAVEGFAFGAGAALAFACDRVVAARDATFSTAFTGVGLAGDMGIFASLPARVGAAAARQLMLLPRRLSGSEAKDLGLADSVAEPGQVLARALQDATDISAGPPLALAGIKAMYNGAPCSPAETLEREVDLQARLFDTDDFAEGVSAFQERRRPAFHGR